MSADAPGPEDEAAWVLQSEDTGRLKRAIRSARRAGVVRIVPQTRWRVCLEVDAPSYLDARRVAKRLRAPIEPRRDCDVAWAPRGRGFWLVVVDQPAAALPQILDDQDLPYRDLAWPSDPEAPIRLCLPNVGATDPLAFRSALAAGGLRVRAIYEVGGCRR